MRVKCKIKKCEFWSIAQAIVRKHNVHFHLDFCIIFKIENWPVEAAVAIRKEKEFDNCNFYDYWEYENERLVIYQLK